jgi:hypothetical protein
MYRDQMRSKIETAKREASKTPLRPRICRGPGCVSLFFVCSHCDHGQRYCSESCRAAARFQQRRAANHRYQRTEPGRLNHCHRQKAYRQRHGRFGVTDQDPRPITDPGVIGSAARPRCSVCGRQSDWIDPFSHLPPRHRARSQRLPFGRGPKNYAFA